MMKNVTGPASPGPTTRPVTWYLTSLGLKTGVIKIVISQSVNHFYWFYLLNIYPSCFNYPLKKHSSHNSSDHILLFFCASPHTPLCSSFWMTALDLTGLPVHSALHTQTEGSAWGFISPLSRESLQSITIGTGLEKPIGITLRSHLHPGVPLQDLAEAILESHSQMTSSPLLLSLLTSL